MASKNTVILKLNGNRRQNEYVADGAITPGHLVKLDSDGKVTVHASAGGNTTRMFAIEDLYQGLTIDDAYAQNDRLQVVHLQAGDEVNALLKNGETIVVGDYLESAGDGTLQKHTAGSAGVVEYPEAVVGIAKEAVDMSGSSGVDPSSRIAIEIV